MPDQVKVEASQARAMLVAVARRGQHLEMPMKAVSVMLAQSVRENFAAGGRYSSADSIMGGPNKWAPVLHRESTVVKGRTTVTARQRARLAGTSVLMRSGMRGGLMASITASSSQSTAWASTNKVYAAIHNFGGKTKPHIIAPRNAKALAFLTGMQQVITRSVHHPGSNIPARPYMVIQPEDVLDAQEILADFLLGEKG